MSYFIANTITFSKDKTTFRVKGGDNNVVPRSNNWSHDIESRHLFSEVSSGNIQFSPGNTKGYIISTISNELKKEFGGTWNDQTDLYHTYVIREKTIEQAREWIKVYDDPVYKNTSDEWKKKEIEHFHYLIDNFDELKAKLIHFENEFLRRVFSEMNQKSGEYIVCDQDGDRYVYGLKRGGAYITDELNKAEKFGYARAKQIASRFKEFQVKEFCTL